MKIFSIISKNFYILILYITSIKCAEATSLGNYCFAAAALGMLTEYQNCFRNDEYILDKNILYVLENLFNSDFVSLYENFNDIINLLDTNGVIISGRQNDASEFLEFILNRKLEHDISLLYDYNEDTNDLKFIPDFISNFCYITREKDNNLKSKSYLSNLDENLIICDLFFENIVFDASECFKNEKIIMTPEVIILLFNVNLPEEIAKYSNHSFGIQNHHEFTVLSADKNEKYNLIGAVVHDGSSLDCGHYFYFKEDSNKKWVCYSNNEKCELIETTKIPNILVFKKKIEE